ncbi:MAG: hypothetical protein ACYS7Y_21515, partial [Planctomycetota bacterium]
CRILLWGAFRFHGEYSNRKPSQLPAKKLTYLNGLGITWAMRKTNFHSSPKSSGLTTDRQSLV